MLLKPLILFLKEPTPKKATNGTVAKKANDESSSEEESSDEVSFWLLYNYTSLACSSWLFA